jgi:flagellar basal body-associated protein FliL
MISLMTNPAMPAPRKKRGPLFWVLISVAVLVVLVIMAVGGAGYYGFKMMQEKGIDSKLLKEHPDFAAAKLVVLMNPDAEIVSEDVDAGTIRIRSKRTGKESVITVDPATKDIKSTPVELTDLPQSLKEKP